MWRAWRAKAPKCASQMRRARGIARGRERLEELVAQGERIYGVNTGVGGNVGFSVPPEQMDLLQLNLLRHLGCATGQLCRARWCGAAPCARRHVCHGRVPVRPELVMPWRRCSTAA